VLEDSNFTIPDVNDIVVIVVPDEVVCVKVDVNDIEVDDVKNDVNVVDYPTNDYVVQHSQVKVQCNVDPNVDVKSDMLSLEWCKLMLKLMTSTHKQM